MSTPASDIPRLLTVIAVAGAVFTVGGAVYLRGAADPADDELPSGGAPVRLVGEHTLESVAALIGNPGEFRYDPKTRTATSRKSLLIEGRLVLGEPGRPESGQTLEMSTDACGDLSVRIAPGGELALHNSTLTTVGKVLANGQCPQGYALHVAGRLTLERSNLDYMSGSLSESVAAEGSVIVRNSSITRGDGFCLKIPAPDGRRHVLEGSTLAVNAGWAVMIGGNTPADAPVVFRNCAFKAESGPLTVMADDARVELIDCITARGGRIGFDRLSGAARVRIAWTAVVEVRRGEPEPGATEPGATGPLAGVSVVAESVAEAGLPETVQAVTGPDGRARLVLTDWTAAPGAAEPSPANRSGPHRVRILRDGKVLAETRLDVRGLNHTEVVTVRNAK